VLADGSATSRQGLEFLLAIGGVEVLASVADLPALVEAVHHGSPDLAVIDAALPFNGSASGVSAALALKAEQPGLGVIVIASHADTDEVLRLVDGAESGMGYLLTETVQDVLGLLDALRRVAAGGLALSPEVVGSLVAAGSRSEPLSTLSGRDQEVLSLVAQGRSNTGIAEALLLSGRTTDNHVSDLLRDLGVQHDGTENGRARATLALLRPH
jgi:DNA-binding NarL/FixJ family response regulator